MTEDRETFSEEGPLCPYCGRQYTADDSWFYDERLVEMECDGCEKTFTVSVCTTTTWTCDVKEETTKPSEKS